MPGFSARELLVVESHRRHDAGTEVLQHDVGLAHQRGEDLLAAVAAQVEADALLAAVVDGEIDALAAHHRRVAARLLAARRLDLDDLGAEVGQDHAAARAGLETRQLENTNAVQRKGHGYSTMSFLRLCTNATTSRCSFAPTLNLASVAAAWLRKVLQSLSLMRMPRWASAMSRPV